jgi:hypothetical protein
MQAHPQMVRFFSITGPHSVPCLLCSAWCWCLVSVLHVHSGAGPRVAEAATLMLILHLPAAEVVAAELGARSVPELLICGSQVRCVSGARWQS